jgi:hypothetical protein
LCLLSPEIKKKVAYSYWNNILSCIFIVQQDTALLDGPDLISAGECSDDGGGSINVSLKFVQKFYFVRPIKNERTRLKVQHPAAQ